MRPLLFRTIREQIVDQLRNDVLSGQMAEDEPLREADLANRFGVSRGPIRDALLQLTQEGALVYQPNCGVRVSRGAAEEIRDLIVALRRQIETAALAMVFDDLSEEDFENWGRQLAELKQACRDEDMSCIVALDMAFHRSLVRRCGHPDLEAIWLPITVRMRLVYSTHRDLMQVYEEHAAIVERIRSGDRQAALKELEQHIR